MDTTTTNPLGNAGEYTIETIEAAGSEWMGAPPDSFGECPRAVINVRGSDNKIYTFYFVNSLNTNVLMMGTWIIKKKENKWPYIANLVPGLSGTTNVPIHTSYNNSNSGVETITNFENNIKTYIKNDGIYKYLSYGMAATTLTPWNTNNNKGNMDWPTYLKHILTREFKGANNVSSSTIISAEHLFTEYDDTRIGTPLQLQEDVSTLPSASGGFRKRSRNRNRSRSRKSFKKKVTKYKKTKRKRRITKKRKKAKNKF